MSVQMVARLPLAAVAVGALLGSGPTPPAPTAVRGWLTYGRTSLHDAVSPVAAQPMHGIRWSTPVDLDPQYTGTTLYAHYGSPVITGSNTVIVPVKTGPLDGFRFEAHRGSDGALIWSMDTDYTLPVHWWVPPCSPTLTPRGTLVLPGAGGTVYLVSNPDSASHTVTRVAFFGTAAYNANPSAYNDSIRISTPITSDASGNLYFGFVAEFGAPNNLVSGLARISAAGVGSWAPASTISNDASMAKCVYNCAPAVSADGSTLYVATTNMGGSGFGNGYLVKLNASTLAMQSRVLLFDPFSGNLANLPDDGTATPTIGPDGDVYFGILEAPFGYNHLRGWLLHFNAGLTQSFAPGAFGWDDSPSIVPASAVPSYHGSSSYLLLTKYNNYAEGNGDGVNRVAILDPHDSAVESVSNRVAMREVISVVGPTADPHNRSPERPNAVREWCINTAAVDPITRCAIVNNEDGIAYKWDFTTNRLIQPVVLTIGIGEAYTPTVIGPDGTAYCINNAILFAVGASN